MTNWYDDHVGDVFGIYEAAESDIVHRCWLQLLEDRTPSIACDIGAGTGRDARWLANKGWQVVAVEPSSAMRQRAQALAANDAINWINDQLPNLRQLRATAQQFDVLLLSAVWQHLPPNQRERCFHTLSELLRPDGLLVISLRLGGDALENEVRGFYPVSAEEFARFASDRGLIECARDTAPDRRRRNLNWQTLVFRAP